MSDDKFRVQDVAPRAALFTYLLEWLVDTWCPAGNSPSIWIWVWFDAGPPRKTAPKARLVRRLLFRWGASRTADLATTFVRPTMIRRARGVTTTVKQRFDIAISEPELPVGY
jgi:hypothetical protein